MGLEVVMGFRILRDATAFSQDKSSKATRRVEDPVHLAFIRRLPSAVSGLYGCEACHIRTGSAIHKKKHTGLGQKADDSFTLPLLPDEHKAQHAGNEMEFWRSHGIDPFELAIKLYENTGDATKCIEILRTARQ